jgi:hypothetical protein
MWTKRDWICLGISATATFGVALATFYPTGANATDEPPPATVFKFPAFKLSGVSITASAMQATPPGKDTNGATLVQPGMLPELELTANNRTAQEETIAFAANLRTSTVASAMSRVPMPTSMPTSWKEGFAIDLKPHETRLLQFSTGVRVDQMSSATLRLQAGSSEVDLLTLSTKPTPAQPPLTRAPATQPIFSADKQ